MFGRRSWWHARTARTRSLRQLVLRWQIYRQHLRLSQLRIIKRAKTTQGILLMERPRREGEAALG